MPPKPARRVFVSQRPISRQLWQVFQGLVSIRPIRLLSQLVGIRWEGKDAQRPLLDIVFLLLMSKVFIMRLSLKSVWPSYRIVELA